MTELKILKDMNFNDCVEVFDGDMTGANDTEIKQELKQEAIKWIKELQEEQRYKEGIKIPKEHEFFFDTEYYSFEYVIEFIKYFFNITEEELI